MKKVITTTIAAGLVASVATAGVSTSFDLASAYVFRGATANDGPVFQPGIEASGFGVPEGYGAVAFGAWANYDIDDYDGAVAGSTFSETDWYVSYSLPSLVDGLDLYVGYCEYMYGGAARDEELNIGAGYEVAGVGLGLTLYQGVGGGIGQQTYIEGTAGYGYDFTEELSGSVDASAGFMMQDDSSALDDGFHNYSIGASIGYVLSDIWSIGLSGTYIGQGDDAVLTDALYDVSFVGMLSLAAEM